ncbi:hypothetical protein HYFRA_00009447 [Hymenoscyphus fraxineus]|uniref:NHL repeat-containing protein n=1 Tax=Hymenoscyphus fraxineus TaxID=746836 RepID=A0A9N9PVG8_9HELO|nr:hypothetical protein HYFRA_00009447 [Hymenoscyphus fraxineus]
MLSTIAMSSQVTTQSHVSFRTVYQFSTIITWIENIRVRQNGQLLVTLLTSPDIYLIDTTPGSSAQLVHSFPKLALLGLTEVKPDFFYIAAGNYSLATGLENGSFSIYSLDFTSYDSSSSNTGIESKEIASFPESRVFNGMDTLDVERSLIVIGDSMAGVIWLLNVETGEKRIFLSEPEMQPPPPPAPQTGVNGLKVLKDGDRVWIYFSNTQKKTLCRIPVSFETLEIWGPVEILNQGIGFDDFVLDIESDIVFLADGTGNRIIEVPLGGGEASVFSDGIFGPTSVALGKGLAKGEVFVVTSGLNASSGFVEAGKIVEYKFR